MAADDLDKVIWELGGFGKFQAYQLVLLTWCGMLQAAPIFAFVFLGGNPKHRCRIPGLANDTYDNPNDEALVRYWIPPAVEEDHGGGGGYSKCLVFEHHEARTGNLSGNGGSLRQELNTSTQPCDHWVFDRSQLSTSAVSQWELVCDNAFMKATIHSAFMAGLLIGSVVAGHLADRFGRKPTLNLMLMLQLVTSVCLAFMPDVYSFLAVRCLLGVTVMGIYIPAFVMCNEMTLSSNRVLVNMSMHFAFAVGIMLVALIAFLIREWFWLQIALSCPLITYILYFWFLEESLRWLIGKNHTYSAECLALRIAKHNTVKMPPYLLQKVDVGSKESKHLSIVHLLKTPNLKKNSLILFFAWFVNSLLYYGLSLNTHSLAGNPYFNFFLIGLVEIPAKLYCFSMACIGRRMALFIAFLVAGVCCISNGGISDDRVVLKTFLFMVGKCGAAASFTISYNYSSEVFPTVLRNIGTGSCSMCSRIGGILAPYVIYMDTVIHRFPNFLFGGFGMLAAAAVLFLPETKGRHLPETLEDGERFGRGDICCSCCTGKTDSLPDVDEGPAIELSQPIV